MNAYTGTEPYAFLSYAHADIEKVEPIMIGLKRKMCRIWYDEGLTPGESWNDDLAEHLKKAECVIVMISQNSASSQYVKAEINYAISKQIKLLPVFIEEVELPAGLEMMLGSIQCAKVYSEDCADGQIAKILPHIPKTVFAQKKTPFYESGAYSFFLEKKTVPNPHSWLDTSSDNFFILCREEAGEEKILFEFNAIPAYDIDYTVTQCRAVNDDYFVGEIHGIHIFNVLAGCCLNYPLTGPDFDLLLIFALRIPEDSFPSVHLIDYQYIHINQSAALEGKKIGESPWGNAIDAECKRKLFS